MAKKALPHRSGKLRRLFTFSVRELFFILIGGIGFWLGFPNSLVQIPPLALLLPFSMACLALEAKTPGKAVVNIVTVFIFGGFLASYWLVYPMINYGNVPLPTAVVFVLLLGMFVSVYYIIFGLLLRFFREHLPLALVIPAGALTWGALEYLRGWLFTGVTWFTLSSAMVGWPFWAQGAALAGMFGLSSIYALVAFGFLPLVLQGPAGTGSRRVKQLCPLLSCLVLTLHLGYGAARTERSFTDGPRVIIAQAQGNVDQAQKWIPAKQAATVEHYITLSDQAMSAARRKYGQKPDLLVWPETAMPFYFQHAYSMGKPIRDLAKRANTPILFGVPGKSVKLSNSESYNRVWLLNAAGMDAGYYDKEHLVPFGEYVPPGIYVPFATEFLQGHGFAAGTAEEPLHYEKFSFGILICYEGIFPELAQARVASGANLLVNVSNDAWFADSPAPWQHLQLSAMRAIEQGRYMIRSTNTGASAMIDPAGRIHGVGPLFKDYASAHEAWLLEEKTFYNLHYACISGALAWSPVFFAMLALGRGLWKKASSRRGRP